MCKARPSVLVYAFHPGNGRVLLLVAVGDEQSKARLSRQRTERNPPPHRLCRTCGSRCDDKVGCAPLSSQKKRAGRKAGRRRKNLQKLEAEAVGRRTKVVADLVQQEAGLDALAAIAVDITYSFSTSNRGNRGDGTSRRSLSPVAPIS